MPIINEDQQGSINFSTPNSYVILQNPPPSIRPISTNVVGVVGTATRGNPNVIHQVGDMQEFIRKLGSYDPTKDLYMFALDYFSSGGGVLEVVRAVSTGTVFADLVLPQGVNASGSVTGNVGYLQFESVGTEGNNTFVVIENNPISGYFDMQVRNGSTITNYERLTTLSSDPRYILSVLNSDDNRIVNWISGSTIGTMPLTGTYQMSNGSNGGEVTSDDYVGLETVSGRTGIQLFKESDSVLFVVSAKEDDIITTGLRQHVNDITLTPRDTVYSFPINTSIDNAIAKIDLINDDKVKVLYPLVKRRNPNNRTVELVSPTAFAVALDTVTTYNQSATNRQLPASVIGLERKLTPAEINRLTKGKVNPIYAKRGVGIIFASDYTTSKESELSEFTTRKAKKFLGLSLDSILHFYTGKNIDDDLFTRINNAFTYFLQREQDQKRIGKLGGGKAFSINLSLTNNNSQTVKQNIVNADVKVSLKGNANTFLIKLSAEIENTI